MAKKKKKNLPAVRKSEGSLIIKKGPVKGAASNVDNDDILIPKLVLMQSSSDFVKEETCDSGDIINSITKDVVAARDEELEIVVLDTFKSMQFWRNGEWEKTESWRPEFRDKTRYPSEGMQGKDTVQFKPVVNYYVLLLKDILTPHSFPHVISFKGGSGRVGKHLASHIKQLERVGAASFAQAFMLGSENAEFEKYKFKAWTCQKGRYLSEEEYEVAEKWFDTIHKDAEKIIVDQSVEVEANEEIEVQAKPVKPQRSRSRRAKKGDIPF